MTKPGVHLSPHSNSLLYGKGIFTTIAIVDAVPFSYTRHWNRLISNAEKIGLDARSLDRERLLDSIKREINDRSLNSGRVRVSIYDGTPSARWSQTESPSNGLASSILTAESSSRLSNIRVSTSPYPVNSRSPLAGVKSSNYLEPILSLEEAKSRGFHEAIRVNENGFVTSACMANVFWLRDGCLFTPALSTGCLAGTTREFILENLECSEVETTIDELDRADAIFLTSAGLGAVEVAEFGERKLDPSQHEILRILPF